jgi:negative regulator of sigma-B (phosphoserine phosphatase)
MAPNVSHRSTPKKGESVSGDRVFVAQSDHELFVAVIDALGHGERADEAAAKAVEALSTVEAGTPLAARFETVHTALRHSRGAAMSALLVLRRNVFAAGVGDVGFRSVGIKVPFVSTPGILGAARRPLRMAEAPLPPGRSRFFLHSDGVSSRFSADDVTDLDAEAACTAIFAVWAGSHDDATLAVVDF